MAKVLFIVNSRGSQPKRLLDWMLEEGLEVDTYIGDTDSLPENLDGYDGMVLFGGGLMPNDFEKAPWLAQERKLATTAIQRDFPTLGICLGGQLIADVAGGDVRAKYGIPEVGSVNIFPTESGHKDDLMSALGDGAPMIEFHEDQIKKLPAGAVLLASSKDVENQAFRLGQNIYGLQFHPEASATSVQFWDPQEIIEKGLDFKEIKDEAYRNHRANTDASLSLARSFADKIRKQANDNDFSNLLNKVVVEGELSKAPGSILALVRGGEILEYQAEGNLDDNNQSVTLQTRFRIASMSKSFLVATALKLHEDRVIDLTRSLSDYLPDSHFYFEGREQKIPLWMFFANCSGLPEDNAWGDRHINISREELSELASEGFQLSASVGDCYQYSNLGMALVGLAISQATGESIDQLMLRMMIKPLGLINTNFVPDKGTAHGFRSYDAGESFQPEPSLGNGALDCIGGLYSTVQDIASWIAFLNGHEDGEEILSIESRRLMQRSMTAIYANDSSQFLDSAAYGLGLRTDADQRFGKIVHHSGGLPGFSSYMRWHPKSGYAAIAFSNSDAVGASKAVIALLDSVLLRQINSPAQTWAETLVAQKFVDCRLLQEDLTKLAEFDGLSENLFQDLPLKQREQNLKHHLQKVGKPLKIQKPIQERTYKTSLASEANWSIDCERGILNITIRLVGLKRPLLQSLVIEAKPL